MTLPETSNNGVTTATKISSMMKECRLEVAMALTSFGGEELGLIKDCGVCIFRN